MKAMNNNKGLMQGKPLQYWKDNAEEEYTDVPISVLEYIAVLENKTNQIVIDELELRLSISGNDCPHHICSKIQKRIYELKQTL